MPARRFIEVCQRELKPMIGGGKMRGRIVFDQPYAAIQHEDLTFRHPIGGEAKYLSNALASEVHPNLADLARNLFNLPLLTNFILVMESIQENASLRAPLEFNDLRRSGQVAIYDGTAKVYNRPPLQRRLSEAQMDRKDVLREMGYGR